MVQWCTACKCLSVCSVRASCPVRWTVNQCATLQHCGPSIIASASPQLALQHGLKQGSRELFSNVFVLIAKCICPNYPMYFRYSIRGAVTNKAAVNCLKCASRCPTNNVSCHCSVVNQAILGGTFESFSSSLASLNNFHSSTTSATVQTVTGVLLTMSIYLLCCQPIHLGWPASALQYYSQPQSTFF